ncbi:neural cell adhesion molecule 1-like isoform X2 [Amphiura filiformis]|uniref:neural cell adhesion molecule 1-like isoform X2 n=1 Tax=Amphiura filiformis TaxID=82378 RepID=UPI003B2228EF
MERDIHTSIVSGRFLRNLMVITVCLLSITAGISKEFVATQATKNQVVVGSTTFTLTEEVQQCMDIMNRQIPPVSNPGSFVSKCVNDQRTTTSAPGQPRFVDSDIKKIRASEGDSVVLPCAVIDRRNHSIEWAKTRNSVVNLYDFDGNTGKIDDKTKNRPGVKGRFVTEFNISSDIFDIRIFDVRRGDNGTYQCTIYTSRSPNFRLIDLEVQIPVKITRIAPETYPYFNITRPNTRFFNESTTAHMTCITDGTGDITILWVREPKGCKTCQNCNIPKDYKTDYDEYEPERLIYNRSLVIPNISRDNSTCFGVKAENLGSRNEWRLIDVVVQFKPRVIAVNGDIRGGPGGYLTLMCKIEALPAAKVIWRTPNGNRTYDESITNGISKYPLSYLEPSTEYGNYTCEASNLLGSATSQIEVNGKPIAPNILSPRTSTRKHAYTLCWERGEPKPDSNINEIPTTRYVADYRGEWIEVKRDGTSVYSQVVYSHDIPLRVFIPTPYEQKDYCETLRDLRPNTTYTIWLYGENQYGKGFRTEYKIRTVNEDIPTTTPIMTTPTTTNKPGGSAAEQKSIACIAWRSSTSSFCIFLALLPILYLHFH